MKASKQIASRMRDMLTQDKVGVKQGFSTALENDVNNVLRDYFALDGRAKIKVEQSEKGCGNKGEAVSNDSRHAEILNFRFFA